jgi:SAM-dependent methyltransferase
MKLLGWKEVDVQLRFCVRCFHGIIFPTFDASRLYNNKGAAVRKEIFESYFPGEKYGGKDNSFSIAADFSKISRELLRHQQTAAFVAKTVEATFTGVKEVRILDWGGGDGRIGAMYATLIEMMTGLRASTFVYDYTAWDNIDSDRITIEHLEQMQPFHVIICSHMLEHTHDPIKTVKSAASYLTQGGLILCEVPDERFQILRGLLQRKFGLNYHVCHFSRRSLHRLLERCGLTNINTSYHFLSSYRGNRMSSTVGVAQRGEVPAKTRAVPTILAEMLSLVWFSSRKAIGKYGGLVFNSR